MNTNRIIIVCAMILALVTSSCSNDDEENFTPEYVKYYQQELFEVPYNNFGISKSTVKKMVKRQIKSESDSKIVFNGKGRDLFQVYYFENDKLVEAATFVPASEGSVYPTALSTAYKEWGTMSYKYSIFYAYVTFDFYVGMTKINDHIYVVSYVDHKRVTYIESHHQGTETKTINLPKVMKALEYLE